jgi:ABC-type spermidine/putrescine transport system permease subunit I
MDRLKKELGELSTTQLVLGGVAVLGVGYLIKSQFFQTGRAQVSMAVASWAS